MIGKARTGADFGGLSNYLTAGGEERVSHVETRNTFEHDPEQVAEEMRDAASLSNRVEKPVYHLSLTFPVEDETTQEERLEVMEEVLEDLGLEGHQALIVEHQDMEHPHVHAMVNRVQHEPLAEDYGKAWSNSNDWQRIERSLRQIEKEREWREVAGYHARPEGAEKPSPAPTSGEIQRYKRTGDLPFGDVVEEVAGHHFEEARSWDELEDRLSEHGIWVEAKGRGGVVTDGEEVAKLSDVDRAYSRYKLEQKFDETHAQFRERRDSRSDESREGAFEQDGEEDSVAPDRDRGFAEEGERFVEREGGLEEARRDARRSGGYSEEGSIGGRQKGEGDEATNRWGREPDPERDRPRDQEGGEQRGREAGRGMERIRGHSAAPGDGADENDGSDELDASDDHGNGGSADNHDRANPIYGRGDYREKSVGGGQGSEEDPEVGEETETGGGDDRRRVRAVPESLREGRRTDEPEMTILEGLSGSQKRVWEHLQEDEQEKAAWAFDSLDESAQKELVGHMDGFDREDLTQGFEQIIERQAEHVRQQQESQKQEGQSEGQSHSKGGRAISM